MVICHHQADSPFYVWLDPHGDLRVEKCMMSLMMPNLLTEISSSLVHLVVTKLDVYYQLGGVGEDWV